MAFRTPTPISAEPVDGAQSGRVNVAAAQSGRSNVGAAAQSGRANVGSLAQSGRANVGNLAQSGRANVAVAQSGRANVHTPSPQSGRANVARAQSGRANVHTPVAQSGRANVSDGLPDTSGIPAVTPPATINGSNSYSGTDGEITLEFDFQFNTVWCKDGYQGIYVVEVQTKLGFRLFFTLTDYGGCTVGFHPVTDVAEGFGQGDFCPAPFAHSGHPTYGPPLLYTSADGYLAYGVREDPPGSGNLVSCDANAYPALVGVITDGIGNMTYTPLSDGQAFSVSGHFAYGIKYSEYKLHDWNTIYGGRGEPDGSLAYVGDALVGYPWHYSSSCQTQWGKLPAGPIHSYPDSPSGAYGVGQMDHYTAPPFGGTETYTGTTYGGPNITTEAEAGFSLIAAALKPVYGGSLNPSSAQRHFSATFSNITFNSGAWTPMPTNSDYLGNSPHGHLTVSDGFLHADNCPFDVTAASSTPAHITGRLYFGDALQPGDQVLEFGNVNIGSGIAHTDSSQNTIRLTAHGGILDATVPQKRSRYNLPIAVGSEPLWAPPLPANRDDYGYNSINLVPYESADSLIWLLDDQSWGCTTFTHAPSVTLDSFGSLTGWTATHGTVSGPGLILTATADAYSATRAAGYNKDCRNFRYLHLDVTSSADGPPLTLSINGGAKVFQTPSLVNGSQTLEIDLCHPQGVSGADMTRTGWDKTPGGIYGVQIIDRLIISGVANGQTVTIHSMSLVRKGETCPGTAYLEATNLPLDITPEAEWYPPDVPAPYFTCPNPTQDPDSIYVSLTTSDRLYARLLRNRVDGKLAADLPHAIGYPGFINPYDFTNRPLGYVKATDRLMVPDFVSMVNAQTGLHCTAPADGPNGYPASRMFAAFLTFDEFITAADPAKDTNNAVLTCQPFYSGIKTFPGQMSHVQYAFIKRLGCVVDGLVVKPTGGSASNIRVSLKSCRNVTRTPPQTVTTDKNGYYRFGAVPQAELFTVKTPQSTGFALAWARGQRWIGLVGNNSTPFNPWNFQDAWGRYHRVLVQDGNVLYWRSDFAVPLPTWKLTAIEVTTGGTDSYPRLTMDAQGILRCVFTRTETDGSTNIYRMLSWDDGATWGDGATAGAATMAIAGGRKSTNAVGVDGTYIEAAVVLGSPNILKGRKQGLGDLALSDLYTFIDHDGNPLQVEDDTFHLQQGKAGAARWLLHVHIAGEDSTSDWYSSDLDARSWTRIPASP